MPLEVAPPSPYNETTIRKIAEGTRRIGYVKDI